MELMRLRMERRMRPVFEDAITRQIRKASDRVADGVGLIVEEGPMERAYRDAYREAYNAFARDEYVYLTTRKAEPDDDTRRRLNLILIQFFFANLATIVQAMTRTTRIDLFAIVQQGAQEGLSNREIAGRINESAERIARRRANMRAATAAVQAGEFGRFAAAGQVGIIAHTWITTLDERTRRGENGFNHAAAHTQTVPFTSPFIVSGELLRFPGDTALGASIGNIINCRCVSVYSRQ